MDARPFDFTTLLVPIVVSLETSQVKVWDAHQAELEKLGFEIEAFGPEQLKVNAVPTLLAKSDVANLMNDMIADLAVVGQTQLVDERLTIYSVPWRVTVRSEPIAN